VLRSIPQSSLTRVDKAEVFAGWLNRGHFAKNPNDLNRRKFSIDDGFRS
jgi:hypothetical protein